MEQSLNMKKISTVCLIILMNFISLMSIAQNGQPAKNLLPYKGKYFGQKPPGNIPEIFMPEVFNKYGYVHGKLTFSPDSKELCWVITTSDKSVDIDKRLFIKQKIDGIWTQPVESFMNIERRENGPSYSSDGNRLYYQSRSPLNGVGENKDIDIWFRERNGEGWNEPINLGEPVNSDKDESQPWIASDGSIFFCRDNKKSGETGKGSADIYFSSFADGKYSEPVCLGSEINTEYHETEPCVSPDGSYLLFISNRPGGYSRMMNLYVSFRKTGGGWTQAECLSCKFKIDNIFFPTVTHDGKYLFFCGGYPTEHGYNNSNYYWVGTDVINEMNQFKNNIDTKLENNNFIKIICDDKTAYSNYRRDDGFSCIVSFNGEKILFDTGNERAAFRNNITAAAIDPNEIHKIFISHNHSDHINGLCDFMQMNPDAEVYMSNEMTSNTTGNGIKIYERAKNAALDKIVFVNHNESIYKISDKIYSTGFLNAVINSFTIKEQSLVLDTEKGLVIITGCSHPGIVNVVKRAKKIADKPVYILLGGFHLATNNITEEKVMEIIRELKELGVQKCEATHCTGEMPVNLFRKFFDKNFIEAGSGAVIHF